MNLHVGTSGYAYKEWKGSFYPADLPDRKMLAYYAEHFRTVEVNNTFYRMPKPEVLEGWSGTVGSDFMFVLKAPQRITHFQRLKECEDSVSYLLKVAASLGEKLGPLMFQLPPNFKKDVDRLRDFFALLPPSPRSAFEFRHATWFDDEVFALMREHGVALCVAEVEDGLEVPFVSTANWGYMRLRRPDYTDAELLEWLTRMRGEDWTDAYVFIKHEDEGKGPKIAKRLIDLASKNS